jgi:hypothetical protein
MAIVLAASGTASASFHGEAVYVAHNGCQGHAVRPKRIVIACGDGGLIATNLRYHTYGKRATAITSLLAHDCVPSCAESRFQAFPGMVQLRAIARCSDGRLYYTRLAYRFTHGAPYGGSPTGTANISPEFHCGRVLG